MNTTPRSLDAPQSSVDPLLTLSTVQLAELIRRRDVSAVEVVRAHVNRVKRVNGHINAVVQERFETAMHEALDADKQLDRKARDPDLPPFLGVPFTTKEHYQVAGFPQTAGLVRRRDKIQDRDAVLVRRCRDAGMILLGTTNVPEALMWFESYNKVYGRTTNAYSVHHLSGGSSGGEGAIIGAGGSPFGLGGDIGGSIRNPAFFNGVCGHKPTGGRVPETGCWPGSYGRIGRYRVSGPLSRRVEDLQALMPLLAQPDGLDRTVDGPEWGTAPEYDPRDLTVYWFEKVLVGATPDVREGLLRAVDGLKARGFTVEEWRPPEIEKGLELWLTALGDAGGPKFTDTMGDFKPISLRRNWLKWPLRRSEHIFPVLAAGTLERVTARLRAAAGGTDSEALRLRLQATIEDQLGEHAVLMYPTFHTTAPRHGLPALAATLGFVNCGLVNPMELPATAVPTGFGSRTGLPTGVQLVGKRNLDHLTLFVASELEAALGGWQPGPIRGTPVS